MAWDDLLTLPGNAICLMYKYIKALFIQVYEFRVRKFWFILTSMIPPITKIPEQNPWNLIFWTFWKTFPWARLWVFCWATLTDASNLLIKFSFSVLHTSASLSLSLWWKDFSIKFLHKWKQISEYYRSNIIDHIHVHMKFKLHK